MCSAGNKINEMKKSYWDECSVNCCRVRCIDLHVTVSLAVWDIEWLSSSLHTIDSFLARLHIDVNTNKYSTSFTARHVSVTMVVRSFNQVTLNKRVTSDIFEHLFIAGIVLSENAEESKLSHNKVDGFDVRILMFHQVWDFGWIQSPVGGECSKVFQEELIINITNNWIQERSNLIRNYFNWSIFNLQTK